MRSKKLVADEMVFVKVRRLPATLRLGRIEEVMDANGGGMESAVRPARRLRTSSRRFT